jgi:hypothetical protein
MPPQVNVGPEATNRDVTLNSDKSFVKQSFWWMWQTCLVFMVVNLVNIANARLPNAMNFLKASHMLESMLFTTKSFKPSNVGFFPSPPLMD